MTNQEEYVNSLHSRIDACNIKRWRTMNGHSLWLKFCKVTRNDDDLASSLGNMTMNAKYGRRTFTIPVAFKNNKEKWETMPEFEKEAFGIKASQLRETVQKTEVVDDIICVDQKKYRT